MSGDGGDDDAIGAGGNQAFCEAGVDGDLRLLIVAGQITEERWRVGMDDGEFEGRLAGGEGGDEPPVIEIGCGGADAPDETYVLFVGN